MNSSRDMIAGLGLILRELREAKGWTQAVLAEKSGLHFTTISKIEKEERAASLKTALILTDTLGVPLKRLIPEDWKEKLAVGQVDEKPAAKNKPGKK